MKVYEPKDIRNIGLYGHQGSGKTTLAEAIVYLGKQTNRLCSVVDGNSNFDFEAEEQRRRASMQTAFGYCEWQKRLINILDNPGDSNFIGDTIMSLVGCDLAVLTVSAVDGIQVGTEKAWELLTQEKIPCVIVITKNDKERANYEKVLESLIQTFGNSVVPFTAPIGQEGQFKGVVELLPMKKRLYDQGVYGVQSDAEDELKSQYSGYREKLIERLAEQDDALIDKYFSEGDLSVEDASSALAKGLASGAVVPVLAVNGANALGVDCLLDLVAQYGPTPLERTFKVKKDGSEEVLKVDPKGLFYGFVIKTYVDVHSGKISVFRVISGSLSPDSSFTNLNTGTQERFGQIAKLLGKRQDGAPVAVTGDIVAVTKLKDTKTSHTIGADRGMGLLVTAPLPERCMALALKPKTQGDEDKVSSAVQKLLEEDIGLAFLRDEEAKDWLLEGFGQVHIEASVEKMKRKYGVEVELRPRRVPYRETIKGSVQRVEGKHKKQTGGHGQYGICYIDMEPLPRGGGFVFEDKIFGGAIPRQYIPSVEKGIRDAMAKGVIAGYPVVDVKVVLVDGKYHEVDSDNRSFELAGSRAFKAAFKQCKPIILEPIMNMTIVIPEEYLGDIMGDISARRGRVLGMEAKGKMQVVKAQVPMAEMLTYASDLRSMTSDRGSFTAELSHYEELPPNLAEKLIQEARLEEEEE